MKIYGMISSNNIENLIRILAVDFDGTLSLNEYPDCSLPNIPLINKLKEEQLNGAKLILWTCREGKDLEDALNACTLWGLTFDGINENIVECKKHWGNDTRKIGATIYIDDKAVKPDDYLKS